VYVESCPVLVISRDLTRSASFPPSQSKVLIATSCSQQDYERRSTHESLIVTKNPVLYRESIECCRGRKGQNSCVFCRVLLLAGSSELLRNVIFSLPRISQPKIFSHDAGDHT
jgi:hypothetical protein